MSLEGKDSSFPLKISFFVNFLNKKDLKKFPFSKKLIKGLHSKGEYLPLVGQHNRMTSACGRLDNMHILELFDFLWEMLNIP